jgi:transposase
VSAFIDMHRDRFGVEPICRTLGVSASAHYQRQTGQRSARQLDDERLLERIGELHAANYCAYGYRRTWKALLRSGEKVGRDRVKRLMRANGIQGAKRRGKPWRTTIPDPAATRPPDLVNRDFTAAGLDRLWVPTSATCAAGKAWCSSASSSTSSAAGSWAGSSPRTCAPISSWTRHGWRWPPGSAAPTSSSCITAMPAARADSSGRRNARSRGVAMGARRRRRSDRAGRPAMRSPGRPPAGRKEHRQRFWAAIARGLSSEDAAAEAGVSAAVGVRWFREGGGMPSVALGPPSGRYLSFAEREEIAVLRARGCGVREIARVLGRSPSTISRELRRDTATRGGGLEYRASSAQWHADRRSRRPKPAKLAENPRLPPVCAGPLGTTV